MSNEIASDRFDRVSRPSAKRMVFLDRDGTINVDHGYGYKIEDWEFTTGSEAALRELQQAGYSLAIVTNQSGIAKGKFSVQDLETLHTHVLRCLADQGVQIAAIAVCPHAEADGCGCRKPKIGMATAVESQIGAIDYDQSWMVGDKLSDIAFGKALAIRTALIRSVYSAGDLGDDAPDVVANNLAEAARAILMRSNPGSQREPL